MNDPERILERECAVFTRFLTGLEPSAYVQERFRIAHRVHPQLTADSKWDARLVAAAARGPGWCRLADAYAALMEPHGLLRRKLVMLLAILETCPPYFQILERPTRGGFGGAVLGLAARGLAGTACALAGIVVFLPVRALVRSAGN